MAADYRLRYFFQATPPAKFVAARGPVWLRTDSEDASVSFLAYEILSRALQELTTAHDPRGRLLGAEEERALCRHCYILALFEQCYRRPSAPSVLTALRDRPTAEDLLSFCEERVVEDLVAISTLFAETQVEFYAQPSFVLNPTFQASKLLGGADADLIVSGRLVEIKTLKSGRPDRADKLQLAAYALADWEDKHGIREVAFYLARHGIQKVWSLDEYLERLAGKKVSVGGLRAEFRACCETLIK
jgi:hypothetical protein